MATYTSNYGWTKPSGSDNVDISVLNNNLDDQDSTIHDAFLNMAPPFSESSTYAVDDIVLYGTGLYKCHTAVVTPGSWTGSTNWQVHKLSEGGGGTTDYDELENHPSINNVELSGNKTGAQLGLQNTLTFDNVPTDGSNNPVKSGGVYASDEAIRQWTTAEAKSVSGNPITLTDGSARNAEGLAVTCNPKQNLHGYDHPWAGGAGKNKLNAPDVTVYNAYVFTDTAVNLSPGTYTFAVFVTGTPTTNTQINILDRTGESSILGYTPIRAGRNTITFTTATAITSVASFTNTKNSVAISELQIESGSSFTSYAPYENICPITGYDECVMEVKDEEETTHDTATIAFGQTVYGGSVDFKSGKVTVTYASIASYNGESINEPWLSSIDEYVSGSTPTTGAQVVYPLSEATELVLTPAELELLKGYNYITTNGTTIALDYLPDSLLAEVENYVDAKIPLAPTTDGTYVLTCTVTSGIPAYTWESAT